MFENGMKVKLVSERSTYVLSEVDQEKRTAWAGKGQNGPGWFVNFEDIVKILIEGNWIDITD